MRLEYERLSERLREGKPPPDGKWRLPFDVALIQLLEAGRGRCGPGPEPVTRSTLAGLTDGRD